MSAAEPSAKRRAEDEGGKEDVKRTRVEEEYSEESEDGSGDEDELSDEMQEKLETLRSRVEGLTKSYLKDVMKGLHRFYGSRGGTNREMAAEIVGHLETCARNGGDLEEEAVVVRRVYRACYGGCAGDEEDEDEEDWE